jgi:hypothetical protein
MNQQNGTSRPLFPVPQEEEGWEEKFALQVHTYII